MNDKQRDAERREAERREAERREAERREDERRREAERRQGQERDPRDEGLERGYANRHSEATEPGGLRRQEIPPEALLGDRSPEEVEAEADRRRTEGVERGYANRHAEVAGLEIGDLPAPAPFTRPRTTAEPEGGWEPGYPKVYFSVYDKVAPIVVKTPNEETAVDKANFMTIPPEEVDPLLTDAKMRAEWRVGDRAAERNLEREPSRSAYIPAPGESERRDRGKEETDRLRKEQDTRREEQDRKRDDDRRTEQRR
jgi:hypothetical protein